MTEEFKDYIRRLAQYCCDKTHHSEYRLSFGWMTENHKDDNEHSSVKMDIKIDSVYLNCTIRVYPQVFLHWEDKEYGMIADYVLHEVSHLFIDPVSKLFMWDVPSSQREFTQDTIERQTQRITNVLMGALPDGWYTPEHMKSLPSTWVSAV